MAENNSIIKQAVIIVRTHTVTQQATLRRIERDERKLNRMKARI